MELTANEAIFIAFREDLKSFHDKWRNIFDTVGYSYVPTGICNAMLPIKNEMSMLDYEINYERNKKKG